MRIGDWSSDVCSSDLFAIRARDFPMFVHALAVQAFGRHARGSGADLVLRLKVDALRFQRSVIDACVDIKLGKALVDMIGPRFAPVGEKFGDRKSTRLNSSH